MIESLSLVLSITSLHTHTPMLVLGSSLSALTQLLLGWHQLMASEPSHPEQFLTLVKIANLDKHFGIKKKTLIKYFRLEICKSYVYA